jgi:hypothetical protein
MLPWRLCSTFHRSVSSLPTDCMALYPRRLSFFFNGLLRSPRLNLSTSLKFQCLTPDCSMMQLTRMLPVRVGRGQRYTAVCCTLHSLLRIPCMQLISMEFNCMETGVLVKPGKFSQIYQQTNNKKTKQTPCPQSTSELYPPIDRPFVAKLPTFTERYYVISVTDPYGCILGFLGRSRYFFLSSSSSVVLTRLSGPRSRPTTPQKIW